MEDTEISFEGIRSYTDLEAKEAFKRIADNPNLEKIIKFLFPGNSPDMIKGVIRSLNGVEDFQVKIMASVIDSILKYTASKLTYSGIENIKDGRKHLLLSNHRDIVLDPAIIQFIFYKNSVPTTEIAVGDNLITSSFIEDLVRSNRMIKVIRGGTIREKYVNSLVLSNYIRKSIVPQRCSIWIAQRNGRSKNGVDATEQGLLKMLDISGSDDFVKNLSELSIIPVSISYQFEPCDFLKARELYISKRHKYTKMPGEDLNSILTGVKQNKGNIHFHFDKPLDNQMIINCAKGEKNERFQMLSSQIDQKIHKMYKLWNNNYIAYDILNKSDQYKEMYSPKDKVEFIVYMEKGLSQIIEQDQDIDYDELRDVFLSIYANPIYSL